MCEIMRVRNHVYVSTFSNIQSARCQWIRDVNRGWFISFFQFLVDVRACPLTWSANAAHCCTRIRRRIDACLCLPCLSCFGPLPKSSLHARRSWSGERASQPKQGNECHQTIDILLGGYCSWHEAAQLWIQLPYFNYIVTRYPETAQ